MALGGGGQVLSHVTLHLAASPGVQGARQQPLASLLLNSSLPRLFPQCMHFSFNSYNNLKVYVIVAALDGNHDSGQSLRILTRNVH